MQLFFDDAACTQMKAEYAAMSDNDLAAAAGELPEDMQAMLLKIKNNSWANREEEFRIHEYEPYSNPNSWSGRLLTNPYSLLNNPTGIYGQSGDLLYVFVDSDVPQDATLEMEGVQNASPSGNLKSLKKGLNIVPVGSDYSTQFIRYTVNTTGDKVIADFPKIKIHIENGVLNGYFDKSRHTDADWVEISQKMATHPIIQVKGEKVLFHMHRQYVVAACPATITDAIGWWDQLMYWEQALMGIDDVCPSKFNNLMLCVSGSDSYMYATSYRTYYQYGTLSSILPWSVIYNSAGGCWGPAHEIGHMNQGAINMVGCTEVSNNLFSNVAIFNIGKYTTRGNSMSDCYKDFRNNVCFNLRGAVFSMTRMYYQLFLYYHAAGHNTQFYPTLFKLLRETPMPRKAQAKGSEDLLLFAEKCCEAAGEDLTEFFEAWGFFVPVENAHIGDYANYYLTVTEKEIAATKAKLQQYPKKNGNIMFIEDRAARSPRTDGVEGDRLDYSWDVAVGRMGDVGQWGQYIGDGEQAQGYRYSKAGTKITILPGTGAVGFKVYNEEGKLISMSNSYTIVLPDNVGNGKLRVVAAQANGEDVDILSVSEGTEEEQLSALNTALETAKGYLDLSLAANTRAGYYHTDALADLKAVYTAALAAKENADQSEYTYGEWSVLIDNEIINLLDDNNAIIKIKEHNFYSLTSVQYNGYGIQVSSDGVLSCTTSTSVKNSDSRKKWEFIPTDREDIYYVRNKSGKYVSQLLQSVTGLAEVTSMKEALKFKVVAVGDGSFYLQAQDEYGKCMHCDASHRLVGWDTSATASHWYITVTENNAVKYELAALDSLIGIATSILDKVIDAEQSADGNIVIKSTVYPTVYPDNFVALVSNLQEARDKGAAAYGNKNTYLSEIDALTRTLDAIEGTYNILPDPIEPSSESEVTWYYIKGVGNQLYCSLDTVNKRSMKNLLMEEISDPEARCYWWCFIPTGVENEYYLYNAYTRACVYSLSSGVLRADGTELGVPYTATIDEGKFAYTLTNGAYYWTASNYARVSKTASDNNGLWLFEKIVTEQSDILTGIESVTSAPVLNDGAYYNLDGRRVESPTQKGIYIHNGKKLYIK